MVCGNIYRLLFFCQSRLSVTLWMKSTNFGSRSMSEAEGDKIWHVLSLGLAVHQSQGRWTLAQGVLLGHQNTEGCKKICNAFLVHSLSQGDKMWQRYGSGQLTLIPQIWWTLIPGSPQYHATTCTSPSLTHSFIYLFIRYTNFIARIHLN